MSESLVHRATAALLRELVEGAAEKEAWILNPGDAGILRSLDGLTAAQASTPSATGSSVASHVAHLTYGLGLLNRWAAGESPFAEASYAASWERTRVDDAEWARLRGELAAEGRRWLESVARPRGLDEAELKGVISSVVHLAYHFGAIRQIEPRAKGPKARD